MYEIFEILLKAHHKTVADVCRATGINQSTLSNWKKRRNLLAPKNAQLIADYFGVTLDYLMGKDLEKHDIHFEHRIKLKDSRKGIVVPVLGRISAGIPLNAVQEVLGFEELPEYMDDGSSEYFGLKIRGESMCPRICDGDVIIVRKQSDVDSGDIAVVIVNGCDATCKKVLKNQTGISLMPLNPAFEPMFYSGEEISTLPVVILGKVVELRAKF